jgi:hypothetical protein
MSSTNCHFGRYPTAAGIWQAARRVVSPSQDSGRKGT